MKVQRHKSVIGLVLGEKSILAAEVHRADRPEVRRTAEFVLPPDVSLDSPALAGKALASFLKSNNFSAKAAVVGFPARKLVVKTKEVPPADTSTLNEMLRLQAEGEFPAELKDLVFDYQREDNATSVLLLATPQANIDAATAICRAAGLRAVSVTATALALGAATGRGMTRDGLVLSVGAGGAELTSQHRLNTSAMRHVRLSDNERSVAGELRRAVMSLTQDTSGRELVMWSALPNFDASSLGQSTGLLVRSPDLGALGVKLLGDAKNDAKFAPAVAAAMVGLGDLPPIANFLHSKLAPPKERAIPRGAVLAGLAAIILGIVGFYGYSELQKQQDAVDTLSRQLTSSEPSIKRAETFVSTISFAEGWHLRDSRYLGCLRAITSAFPDDGQTYCVNLSLKELPKPTGSNKKPVDVMILTGSIFGKTSDQRRAQDVLSSLKRSSYFTDVKIVGIQDVGRSQQVSFTINFTYRPPAAATNPSTPSPSSPLPSASVRATP